MKRRVFRSSRQSHVLPATRSSIAESLTFATARRLATDQIATGGNRLAELVGREVLTRLREWLGIGTSSSYLGIDAGPYRIEARRICIDKNTRDGAICRPLCNFVAKVDEEIVLDDGAETSRAFLLTGSLASGEALPAVRVPASRFSAMSWITDQWGFGAIVNAGQSTRDQLREAIQRLSPNPRQRRVFTHTGWREIQTQWRYLTAAGAVGIDGIEVDLGQELARYSLPSIPHDPVNAMKISLRLLDIAPLAVTAALWSAMYRAPLASSYPLDVSIGVEGVTGSLKSTLVALFLSHFGPFERTSLPGSWSSTANQLERRAFVLKDSVFVIDDYAPTPLDARELESKAARLLRSQGNLAGRGRLRADLTERPAFAPRGLIVFTGEQHPPGQSLLARTVITELERSKVDFEALTKAQDGVAQLRHAMAGYVLWLAPQMSRLPSLLRQTFEGARSRATSAGDHLRVPEALAHLWLGLHSGLSYAEEIGACTHAEAKEHRGRCWSALLSLGRTQAQAVEAERPSRRFLSVLLAMLCQGWMVLLPKETDGNGRRDDLLVGWEDGESIYLTPDSTYRAVAHFCRDAGEPFPVRQVRLTSDLAREGLTECDAGRHTTTACIGGHTCRVLRLNKRAVEAFLGEELSSGKTGVTTFTGSEE